MLGTAGLAAAASIMLWSPQGAYALWEEDAASVSSGVLSTGEAALEISGPLSVTVDGVAIDQSADLVCVGDAATIAIPVTVRATGTNMSPTLHRSGSTNTPAQVTDVDLDDVNAALSPAPAAQEHVIHLDVLSYKAGVVHVQEELALTVREGAAWAPHVDVATTLTFDDTTRACEAKIVTTWDTALSEQPPTILFGAGSGGTLDWGDGSPVQDIEPEVPMIAPLPDGPGKKLTVTINGRVPHVKFPSSSLPETLVSVDRWDEGTRTTSLAGAFESLDYLESVVSPPRTVTDVSGAFAGIRTNVRVDHWDTSNITNMSRLFTSARSFDGDLSGWDTSKVTDMNTMFEQANAFTGRGLSEWDTSSAVNMGRMFKDTPRFNADLSNWNTSSATAMRSMFSGAYAFNADLSRWQTGNVTDMDNMFYLAARFSGDLRAWNVQHIPVQPPNFGYGSLITHYPIWGTTGLAPDDEAPARDDVPRPGPDLAPEDEELVSDVVEGVDGGDAAAETESAPQTEGLEEPEATERGDDETFAEALQCPEEEAGSPGDE